MGLAAYVWLPADGTTAGRSELMLVYVFLYASVRACNYV